MISMSMDRCSDLLNPLLVIDILYRFLAACGVDGVKTDVQASIDELDNGADRQRISVAYQNAFKFASTKHFNRRSIYCSCNHLPHFPNAIITLS